MPSDPFPPRSEPITDPETVAAWSEYEAMSRRAKVQYRNMPISKGKATLENWGRCIHCRTRTRARDGQCKRCKRTVVAL